MMAVMVTVPEGMGPGQQLSVDPDGPEGPLPPVTVVVRKPEARSLGSDRSSSTYRCARRSRTAWRPGSSSRCRCPQRRRRSR